MVSPVFCGEVVLEKAAARLEFFPICHLKYDSSGSIAKLAGPAPYQSIQTIRIFNIILSNILRDTIKSKLKTKNQTHLINTPEDS